MMKHKTKAKIGFGIMGIALVLVIAIVGTLLFMHQRVAAPSPSPNIEIAEVSDGFPEVDWAYWKGVNPDIIGWVTVPDTNINQPIVQAPDDDPTYYLFHDIYGDFNYMGCPYLDCGNAEEGLLSQNCVIFAHNLGKDDDALFHDFTNYEDEAYSLEHKMIYLQTPDWKKKINTHFVCITMGWEKTKRVEFESFPDYLNWYKQQRDSATVVLDPSDPIDDKTSNYTFCTCTYNYWGNGRTLVFAS